MGERQFTRIYEDDDEKVTWVYDLDFNTYGPVSVDIKTKREIQKIKIEKNGKKTKNPGRTSNALIQNETPKRGRPRQK
jgi:hypothetical protein